MMMMMRMMQVILFVALLVLAASAHTQFYLPIDCDDIYRHDNTSSSGMYTIYPGGPTTPLQVYCDMDTDGGRWTGVKYRRFVTAVCIQYSRTRHPHKAAFRHRAPGVTVVTSFKEQKRHTARAVEEVDGSNKHRAFIQETAICVLCDGGPAINADNYCRCNQVIHRRIDGTENFFRPWRHYKTGFGNVAGEYWLGLENIFLLSMRKENELRVDMEDWEGGKASAQYSSFSIDTENAGYQLHIGSFTGGAAGDALGEHNNMKFTTFDKDQDIWGKNCAQHFLGGFWYLNCHGTNPTGMYAPHGALPFSNAQVTWQKWKGDNYSLKTLAMKIRSAATCTCTHQPD